MQERLQLLDCWLQHLLLLLSGTAVKVFIIVEELYNYFIFYTTSAAQTNTWYKLSQTFYTLLLDLIMVIKEIKVF